MDHSPCDNAPLYPNELAFLVKMRRPGDGPADFCNGRIEHLVSGRGLRFANAEELFRFLQEILRTNWEQPENR